ncbi:MAG: hypothetical protein JWO94_3600 [Verrucomicrobiaceae bacterium]|nr:hypothetical protein [Verrucomicrobiaceae bacterium]
MSRIRPAILLIGVLVCTPILVLHQFGIFKELSEGVLHVLEQRLVLPSPDLVSLRVLNFGYYTFMAFLCAWICVRMPRQSHRFAFLLALCFLTLVLCPLLAFNGILFEPFSGLAAILGAGLLGLMFSGTERGQRLDKFRHLFIGRLSESQFASLVKGSEPVKLNSKREVTSLTCRLLNTDKLSQDLDPEQLELLGSAFMKAVAEFLVAQGGYLDVCNAQGITVQFGFPVADPDHALHASKAALALRLFLHDLSAELEKRWGQEPQIGTGISSGSAVCGLIGYREFQFYSVLGEPPDMSRRLSNMHGVYGAPLLISARSFNLLKAAVEVRPMEMIAAPGQTSVSEVYELLAEKGTLTPPETAARDAFWEGVVALRQGDPKIALAKLTAATLKDRDDAPLKYFLERAQAASSGTGDKATRKTDALA